MVEREQKDQEGGEMVVLERGEHSIRDTGAEC